MELVLLAQVNPDNPAFKAGQIVGIVIAVILSASIPISFGAKRGQPVLGAVGAVCAIPAALLLGCLGGLPVAGLFCLIIMMVSNSGGGTKRKKRRKKPRRDDYEDEDDDHDRPRRSRRDAYDEDDVDYDDRPRRSRRDDDYDDEDDDRPRRRRYDD